MWSEPTVGDRPFLSGLIRRFRACPVEWLFAVALIGLLVRAWVVFERIGYLPLPFWPDPQDVYADGYSTAWWAFNGAMYDIWKTVYPPLSFVLTRAFALSRCYDADVTYARDCDWGLWWSLLAFYALNAYIVFRAYSKIVPDQAWPRMLALMLGLPMLYSFEHLNLLVITYTGLFLAFSPNIRSVWVRWFGMAIAINLKVYLIVVLLGQLLKKRWRWVEGCIVTTIVVAVVAYAIIGQGDPVTLYRNIAIFSSDPDRASSWYFVFYASSYASMVEFLDSKFRLMPFIGSWKLEFWGVFLTWLLRAVQAASLAAFAAIWLKPGPISRYRIAALCYLLAIISNETGGYTTAGAIFFAFFEPWRGVGRKLAIVCAYLLCLALDVRLVPIGTHVVNGYFSGRPVWQDMWLSAGPFIRPGLIMGMQLGLVGATFGDLWRTRQPSPKPLAAVPQPL